MNYKIGDRIIDNYLGKGIIEKIVSKDLFIILYDKDPPYEYNCSDNPTIQFAKNIKLGVKL